MAEAPPTDIEARDDVRRSARVVMTIIVRRAFRTDGSPVPDSHSFTPDNLSFMERSIFRKATGLPVSAYLGAGFDIDSIQALWWAARRANGETFLTLDKALEEWPEDVGPDDLDIEVDDGEDDRPEA